MRPLYDDVMSLYDVMVIFLFTELTTQLSKSLLNTKRDILNLKMRRIYETLIKMTSSFSCDDIKLIFLSKLYKKNYMNAKFRPPQHSEQLLRQNTFV